MCPMLSGVSESTIHGRLTDGEKLHDFIDMVNSTDQMKRKKTRTAKDPQLDKAVFICGVKGKHAGTLISSPVLSIQPQKLHTDLRINNPSDCL